MRTIEVPSLVEVSTAASSQKEERKKALFESLPKRIHRFTTLRHSHEGTSRPRSISLEQNDSAKNSHGIPTIQLRPAGLMRWLASRTAIGIVDS